MVEWRADVGAAVDARRLSELERALREQGLVERAPDGTLRLSPKALRRLGETALADVLRAARARAGDRNTASAGAAGELSGSSRAWEFGDTQPWDVPRTVRNAVLRAGMPIGLDVSDVEVAETEHRARAVAIGERLEVLKDYPTPPNCTSPFAPTWINEIVRRQELGASPAV